MSAPLDTPALDQLFTQARTFSAFTAEPVPAETLLQLQALAQWGPTAFNCQPARCVFVRSAEAKARLQACVSAGNVAKVASAPVTVIVATDTHFHEHLPTAGVDYHVPFGGRKASSIGSREQGRHAAEFFTTVKTAYTSA